MIKKIEVDREEIYLKKSLGSWRVVYPIKKDLDKKLTWKNINWFNFVTGGSYWNLLWSALVVLMVIGLIFGYLHDVNVYRSCFNSYEALEVCKNSFGNFSTIDLNIIP